VGKPAPRSGQAEIDNSLAFAGSGWLSGGHDRRVATLPLITDLPGAAVTLPRLSGIYKG
jgi:hypothetical protein